MILAAYVIGAVLSWRTLTMSLLLDLESTGSLDGSDRAAAAFFGALAAVVWPAALLVRSIWRLVKNANALQTPNERLAAQERELQELRRQAREYGLPMPSDYGSSSTGSKAGGSDE